MRTSCNGCRVLRRACRVNCSVRPCLQWIKSNESQANATVFLVKFYGRTGLINLLNAGNENLRPAIFKSLLYEACGRIINPVHGSTGLLWSNNWHLCQAAVEAVLKGQPITRASSDSSQTSHDDNPPLKICDVRHVPKSKSSTAYDQLHQVMKSTRHFKRLARNVEPGIKELTQKLVGCSSHGSGVSQELAHVPVSDCDLPAEAAEASLNKPCANDNDWELELTLGFETRAMTEFVEGKGVNIMDRDDDALCRLNVGLGYDN